MLIKCEQNHFNVTKLTATCQRLEMHSPANTLNPSVLVLGFPPPDFIVWLRLSKIRCVGSCKFSNVSASIEVSIFKVSVFGLSVNCCWFRRIPRDSWPYFSYSRLWETCIFSPGSSAGREIAAGPRQHSRSWLRVPLGPRSIFLFFSRLYLYWNGASSSPIGGLWLLLVTPPLLGVTPTPFNSITSERFQKPLHGSGIGWWEEDGAGTGRTRERVAIHQGTIRGLRRISDLKVLFRPGVREKRRWGMSLRLSKDINLEVGNFRVYRKVGKPPPCHAACLPESKSWIQAFRSACYGCMINVIA
jgi:hypothetical protein